MCLKDLLTKVEIKGINVIFYNNIYVGGGETTDLVKFMTKEYEITNIPKSLLLLNYDKCTISEDLIRVYL